ncbi:hypothetical protein CCACVL1_22977 [Corchorus capsularis]|uniref:Uncharacterized protein n=1 Tax=Corchorus capsularis TaxID=210143 RepID=A0A1R3GVM7_COCAP|nr:hypothetical protein CCACVL1_22977 [Corchorus capsularis]
MAQGEIKRNNGKVDPTERWPNAKASEAIQEM